MTDSDKTKGGNMVIDEIGLRLIEKLCDGLSNKDRAKILEEKIFSNSDFKRRLKEELTRTLKDCKEEDQEATLNGFKDFFSGSSKFITLKESMSKGRSLIDAMADLFKNEYLPDVLITKMSVNTLTPQPNTPKSQNSNTILDVIIADPNESNRIQSLKKLVPALKMERHVRLQWEMDDSEKFDPILEHYCYNLSRNNCKWLKAICKEVKNGSQPNCAFMNHFKTAYVNKMGCMKHADQRMPFFELISDSAKRDATLWTQKIDVYKIAINKEINMIFKNLLYPDKVKYTKQDTLACTDEKIASYVMKQLSDEKAQLLKDLNGFLTGSNGKELVMKYLRQSNTSFESWSHEMAVNYIASKPRIDHILADPPLIKGFLRCNGEFYSTIQNLCNKFHVTSGMFCVLPEENKVASSDNTSCGQRAFLKPEEFIQEISRYLFEPTGNGQCRYEKDLKSFRFESALSTLMYSICYNFLIKKKEEEIPNYEEEDYAGIMEKGFVEDDKKKSVFNKETFVALYRNYVRDLKNKKTEPIEIVRRTKKSVNNTSSERLANYLYSTEMPLGIAKDQVTTINYIHDLDLLVDSVLIDGAWPFFGIRDREINISYDMMRASVLNDIKDKIWPFMDRPKDDDKISKIIIWPFFGIRTTININGLDDIYHLFNLCKLGKFDSRIISIIKECNRFIEKKNTFNEKDVEKEHQKIKNAISKLLEDIDSVKGYFDNLFRKEVDTKVKENYKTQFDDIEDLKKEVKILQNDIEKIDDYKMRYLDTDSDISDEGIRVPIPLFLIVYCHILLTHFYQVVTEECLYSYEDLEKYYGVDNNNIRQFRLRACDVIRNNVSPFIRKMRYELGGDNFIYAPIIINYFKDLIKSVASMKVAKARNEKMNFMADTIIALIKMNANYGIIDKNEEDTILSDYILSVLPQIRKALEGSLKLYDLRPFVAKYGKKYGFKDKDIIKYTPIILDILKTPLLSAMNSQITEEEKKEEMDFLAKTIVTLMKEHSGGLIDNSILSTILPSLKEQLKEIIGKRKKDESPQAG